MKLIIDEYAILRLLKISTTVSSIALLMFSVFLHSSYDIIFFYIPFSIMGVISLFLHLLPLKNKKKITMNQIESLLRLDGGKITVKRLSEVTNTSIGSSEKALNKLVAQNYLDAEIIETDLVYKLK